MTEYQYWTQKQIVESGRFPFSKGQLAQFMLYRHKNGLDKAVRKIGKRCYIRVDLLQAWIEGQSSE